MTIAARISVYLPLFVRSLVSLSVSVHRSVRGEAMAWN